METQQIPVGGSIGAEIAELRERFPRTKDLYREVCVLLFFRYGITPTANKLYQLVRKGSMSAPTEALNLFWSTLRERSNLAIQHADLPDELRVLAGETIAALWRSAQEMSNESIAVARAEATAAVDAARADEAQARARCVDTVDELRETRTQLAARQDEVGNLRQDLAASGATIAGLESKILEMQAQLTQLQTVVNHCNQERVDERERLDMRTALAERRYADMEKRALVEIDRERTVAAKLQKTLDAERAAHKAATERDRTEYSDSLSKIAMLREQLTSLQGALDARIAESGRDRSELKVMDRQLRATILQAAVAEARAEQLQKELDRLHSIYQEKLAPVRKRPKKRTTLPEEQTRNPDDLAENQ